MTSVESWKTISGYGSISVLWKDGSQHVSTESTTSVECIALEPSKSLVIDAFKAVYMAATAADATETLLLVQHSVVVVGESVAYYIVGERETPDSCLIQRRIGLSVIRTWLL